MVTHEKEQASEETNTTRTVTRDDPHAPISMPSMLLYAKWFIHTLDQYCSNLNANFYFLKAKAQTFKGFTDGRKIKVIALKMSLLMKVETMMMV